MDNENNDCKVVLQGIKKIGNIEPLWHLPQEKLPEIDPLGNSDLWMDSDLCWVCYWVEDFGIAINIATYHPHRKGSGWVEMNTLKSLPEPIAWILVDVPEKYYPE